MGADNPPVENNGGSNNEIKEENISKNKLDTPAEPTKKRNYRKRKSTENKTPLSEGEIEDSDEEINRFNLNDFKIAKKNKALDENIDADSDFSIDDSSDEETEKRPDDIHLKEIQKEVNNSNTSDIPEIDIKNEKDAKKENDPKVEPEVKPKTDIWKKRTVGVLFNEALKRYYERKAARGC